MFLLVLAHPGTAHPGSPGQRAVKWLLFVVVTIVTDRPTDIQRDHVTPSVTIGHIYVVLQCGQIIVIQTSEVHFNIECKQLMLLF